MSKHIELTKKEQEIFSCELLNDFEMMEIFAGEGDNIGCSNNCTNNCPTYASQCPCISVKGSCYSY